MCSAGQGTPKASSSVSLAAWLSPACKVGPKSRQGIGITGFTNGDFFVITNQIQQDMEDQFKTYATWINLDKAAICETTSNQACSDNKADVCFSPKYVVARMTLLRWHFQPQHLYIYATWVLLCLGWALPSYLLETVQASMASRVYLWVGWNPAGFWESIMVRHAASTIFIQLAIIHMWFSGSRAPVIVTQLFTSHKRTINEQISHPWFTQPILKIRGTHPQPCVSTANPHTKGPPIAAITLAAWSNFSRSCGEATSGKLDGQKERWRMHSGTVGIDRTTVCKLFVFKYDKIYDL